MSKFERECRYIVIKRKDLALVPVAYRRSLVEPLGSLMSHIPHREYVVVESDWPEYEQVWHMIEARVTGRPSELERLRTEAQALREEVAALRKDKARLDAIEGNCWDIRYDSSQNADAGDSSISIEIVGHYQGKPHVRVLGENYTENLRAAIDQAMTAEAYPPERPEYDEHGRPLRAMLDEGKEVGDA